MRHQKTRNKLSRDSAHRKALLMNLSKELIEHERIKTTEAKAKAVRPEVEKLITLAKRGDLHARRQALSTLSQDKFAVHKLFAEVAPPLRRAPGRLHAHPQARPAPQRRDRDGLHRAGLAPPGAAAGVFGWSRSSRSSTTAPASAAGPASPASAPSRRSSSGPCRTILGEHRRRGPPLRLTVAGRTDRGVHAWAQVASYRHEAVDPLRLNGLLPDDVAVLASEPAPPGFDARRDARSRTYCYRVLARRTRSAFERGRAYWWFGRRSTAGRWRNAPPRSLGRHDFTAFTPTETEHVRFVRDVMRAEWVGEGELLEFWIEADTFMRHMNRVLVGTMLEVAAGRRTFEEFVSLLEGAPRSAAGRTAPAHGLALASVSYGP